MLVERLTYPGVKSLAHMMQVRLVGVDMDEDGITPASLDTVCRSHAPKLLCMVPTLQNPLNSIMSDERRRAIARADEGVDERRQDEQDDQDDQDEKDDRDELKG